MAHINTDYTSRKVSYLGTIDSINNEGLVTKNPHKKEFNRKSIVNFPYVGTITGETDSSAGHYNLQAMFEAIGFYGPGYFVDYKVAEYPSVNTEATLYSDVPTEEAFAALKVKYDAHRAEVAKH